MKNNIKNNIKWILFFAAVCLICMVIWIVRIHKMTENKTAQILQDGKVIQTVDLQSVTEAYEFEVRAADGFNRIRVEQGKIAVIDSDCPDKICVKQGFIENSALPVVCLPHKLSVVITDNDDTHPDAVVGNN